MDVPVHTRRHLLAADQLVTTDDRIIVSAPIEAGNLDLLLETLIAIAARVTDELPTIPEAVLQ